MIAVVTESGEQREPWVDEPGLVGRAVEVGWITRMLDSSSVHRAVLVHGAPGVGKSALLRGWAREARQRGAHVAMVSAASLADSGAAAQLAAQLPETGVSLLLIGASAVRASDVTEQLTEILRSVPVRTRIGVVTRQPFTRDAFRFGWSAEAIDLELGPLELQYAVELLTRLGISDTGAQGQIARWAEGSPLLLTLAANAMSLDPGWSPSVEADEAAVLRQAWRHIAPANVSAVEWKGLSIAAAARVVTPAMVADVPGEDPADVYSALAESTLVIGRGSGVEMHAVARRAFTAELQAVDGAGERQLRRSVADHLYQQGAAGDLSLTVDLAALSRHSVLADGYGWSDSLDLSIRRSEPGDALRVVSALTGRGLKTWGESSADYFRACPERISIATDRAGGLTGYCIAFTPENAPRSAWTDPVVGGALRHADGVLGTSNAIIWRESFSFVDGDDPRVGQRVQGALHVSSVLNSGLANPRYAYLGPESSTGRWQRFLDALAARPLPELNVEFGGRSIAWHLVDFGPSGLLGAQRDIVMYELGAAPAPFDSHRGEPVVETHDTEQNAAIRYAIRWYQRPDRLAASSLGRGDSPDDRCASVRALIDDGLVNAFGTSLAEERLKTVIMAAYIEPAATHDRAAFDLHISRTTYFRLLRQGVTRLAEHIESVLAARRAPSAHADRAA